MKLDGVIDICFWLVLKFSALWYRGLKSYFEGFKGDGVMPCFGSHFENGRHLENFEDAEFLL
jgi:hypothetical protein